MTVNQKLTNQQLSSLGIKRTNNDKGMNATDANIRNNKQTNKKEK
ncbi:MAG: hypothetical protein ACREV6_14600 [Clostridium sp.]